MRPGREKYGFALIAVCGILALLVPVVLERIPQDAQYHIFSDTRTWLSIPNTLNVLSNLPFFIVGIAGLVSLMTTTDRLNIVRSNMTAYLVLFLGTMLTGAGSAYYHLWPDNETLVWDRLPMTLTFMSLYSIIISEFIAERAGRLLLAPLLSAGVASVLYWWFTESHGVGDLRFYAIVQFFPILTTLIILLFFQKKSGSAYGYWILFGSYIAAKLCEHYDSQIHQALVLISGHTIKHILPALGLWILLQTYKTRRHPAP